MLLEVFLYSQCYVNCSLVVLGYSTCYQAQSLPKGLGTPTKSPALLTALWFLDLSTLVSPPFPSRIIGCIGLSLNFCLNSFWVKKSHETLFKQHWLQGKEGGGGLL